MIIFYNINMIDIWPPVSHQNNEIEPLVMNIEHFAKLGNGLYFQHGSCYWDIWQFGEIIEKTVYQQPIYLDLVLNHINRWLAA